jgi:hypothetical protein
MCLVAAIGILSGCAPKPWQESQNRSATGATATDPRALLPKEDLVAVKVVKKELLGKPFMPGGTLAQYQRGNVAYEIFLGEVPTPTDAAIVLAALGPCAEEPQSGTVPGCVLWNRYGSPHLCLCQRAMGRWNHRPL